MKRFGLKKRRLKSSCTRNFFNIVSKPEVLMVTISFFWEERDIRLRQRPFTASSYRLHTTSFIIFDFCKNNWLMFWNSYLVCLFGSHGSHGLGAKEAIPRQWSKPEIYLGPPGGWPIVVMMYNKNWQLINLFGNFTSFAVACHKNLKT